MPVLLEEAIGFLRILPGGTYMDATLGQAGHSTAIARLLGPEGHLIAFDRDPEAIESAEARFVALRAELKEQMPRITIHAAAFAEAASWAEPQSIDGILADFGVSSLQLDTAQRGFSFQADAPLDMRMDPRSGMTAEQVVNQVSEEDLANLIYEFGEERRSRRIARAIVRARPVTTTAQLAKVVTSSAPAIKSDRIHPATRVFQALRIYVNGELDQIASLLQQAPQLLRASRKNGGHQFPLTRGPHCERCISGGKNKRDLDGVDAETSDRDGRRDPKQSAFAQRQVTGGGAGREAGEKQQAGEGARKNFAA